MTNSCGLCSASRAVAAAGAFVILGPVLAYTLGGVSPVQLASAGVAVVALAFGGWRLERARATLARAAVVCSRAANGDLEARVLDVPDGGSIGKIQSAVNRLLDVTDAFVRESQGATTAMCEGRYHRTLLVRGMPGAYREAATAISGTSHTMQSKAAEFRNLAVGFERDACGAVGTVAAELRVSATDMAAIAEGAHDEARVATGAVRTATDNVHTIAAAAEPMSTSVAEIALQSTRSASATHNAAADATGAADVVKALATSCGRVEDVISLISEVAAKTRLLALNASIEAASAGVAGSGFAVVANEVRALAGQSADAAQTIRTQVEDMRKATGDAVAAIQDIVAQIHQVAETATSIAAAAEEQRTATAEIARGIQQTAASARVAQDGIERLTVTADKAGGAARLVLEATGALGRTTERLSQETQAFIARAA